MMSTIAPRSRITRHVGATILALTILAAASAALAQIGGGAGRPVRLEGCWNGTPSDKDVIGVITVSANGTDRRSFGVTALQAYDPPDEGIDVLRPSSLEPITLLLRADEAMRNRFMTASPNKIVVAFGVYRPDSGDLILSSVDVTAKRGHAKSSQTSDGRRNG